MSKTIGALKTMCQWAAASGGEAAPGFQRILDRVDWSAPRMEETPHSLPVVDQWLEQAVALAGDNPLGDLGRAVLADRERLNWFTIYQSYANDPAYRVFLGSHAIIRLTGPKAAWFSDDLTTAVTIQGPGTLYPAHVHKQREVYGVIAGRAQWRRGAEPWIERQPGEVIYHPSGVRHAMRTAEEPLMAFAAWLEEVNLPVGFVTE